MSILNESLYNRKHEDSDYWTTQTEAAPEFDFHLSNPSNIQENGIEAEVKPQRGRPFQKGADSRRHAFTTEERQRGFWAAIESIVIRYPDAVMPDGRHIACNFLKSRQVEAF